MRDREEETCLSFQLALLDLSSHNLNSNNNNTDGDDGDDDKPNLITSPALYSLHNRINDNSGSGRSIIGTFEKTQKNQEVRRRRRIPIMCQLMVFESNNDAISK